LGAHAGVSSWLRYVLSYDSNGQPFLLSYRLSYMLSYDLATLRSAYLVRQKFIIEHVLQFPGAPLGKCGFGQVRFSNRPVDTLWVGTAEDVWQTGHKSGVFL
jgi:hypothetical protein